MLISISGPSRSRAHSSGTRRAERVSLLGRGYASQQRPMLCTAETTGFSGTSTTRFRMPFEICSHTRCHGTLEVALGDSHGGTWRTGLPPKRSNGRDPSGGGAVGAHRRGPSVALAERVVLPTQDLLVDAPSGGSLPRPSGGPDRRQRLEFTCLRGGLSPRMKSAAIEGSLLANWGLWFSRPAWLWPRTRETAQDQAWVQSRRTPRTGLSARIRPSSCPRKMRSRLSVGLRTPSHVASFGSCKALTINRL